MDESLEAVSERDKGTFGISIGTDLAFEGACGIYPDREQIGPPLITQGVREIWVNVRTLFRNMVGAMSTESRVIALPKVLHIALIEEMTIIEALVAKASEGMCGVTYYICDYSTLHQRYSKALIRQANTDKQKEAYALEVQTMQTLLQDSGQHALRQYRLDITGRFGDSWILTHCPVDLLNKHSFKSLRLLESHTGILKDPALWYTKLTNGKDLAHIPFNAFSLQVFGDNTTNFNQFPHGTRQIVLGLAEKFQWNAITTKDRITLSVKSVPDVQMRSTLLSLL
jgi:hypothetical protein